MEDLKLFLRENSNWTSTEANFSLMNQPQNACPQADRIISDLTAYSSNILALKNKLVEIPCALIEEKSVYLFYVRQIDIAIETISNNINKISDIISEVEGWRTRCLDTRRMFTEDKNILWNIIKTRSNPEKVNSIINQLSYADHNVEFELEAIEFEKYETNCSFFHENFAWLDVELTFVSLQGLKDIYLNLYKWGNDIIRFIQKYKVEDKVYSLSLGSNSNSTDVQFDDVDMAINYIFQYGLPQKIIINHPMGELFANFLLKFKQSTELTIHNFSYEVFSSEKDKIENILSSIHK